MLYFFRLPADCGLLDKRHQLVARAPAQDTVPGQGLRITIYHISDHSARRAACLLSPPHSLQHSHQSRGFNDSIIQ